MFDAYHKWLGIPKDQQPPTYYQILAVSPDEVDPEVINASAVRQKRLREELSDWSARSRLREGARRDRTGSLGSA